MKTLAEHIRSLHRDLHMRLGVRKILREGLQHWRNSRQENHAYSRKREQDLAVSNFAIARGVSLTMKNMHEKNMLPERTVHRLGSLLSRFDDRSRK